MIAYFSWAIEAVSGSDGVVSPVLVRNLTTHSYLIGPILFPSRPTGIPQ
jgi:hypothetical protein